MKHNVKSYQRRLKNGKTITVRAYTRKGKDGKGKKDSPSMADSGDELMKLKAKLKKFGELNLSDEERVKLGMLPYKEEQEKKRTEYYNTKAGKDEMTRYARKVTVDGKNYVYNFMHDKVYTSRGKRIRPEDPIFKKVKSKM
jgi:hypothetical protein|nr:MAG: hypothetical protein [Bacteriophage sp.]DAT06195.1 MAG TPA: hypothetical protein [Caudoviricetes sp.]UVX48025.1 MAG: hypothetical protein [Bacteriophage sp.]UVY04325.1 MAG: hypothetical protein [Bacteriophage sp.]UVY15518.1 MAG: hypothetical protein [Bacteriophage sp.]